MYGWKRWYLPALLVVAVLALAAFAAVKMPGLISTPVLASSEEGGSFETSEPDPGECCTPCCTVVFTIVDMTAQADGWYVAENGMTVILDWGDGTTEVLPWGQHTISKTHTYAQEGEYEVSLTIEGVNSVHICRDVVVAKQPTPTPTATNSPTPTNTPTPTFTATPTFTPTPTFTATPTFTPTPTNTPKPTQTPVPCEREPGSPGYDQCKVYLSWVGGQLATWLAATTQLQDPLICPSWPGLLEGDIDSSDGIMRPTRDSCTSPQLVSLPQSAFIREGQVLHVYVLSAKGEDWTCYQDFLLTRVVEVNQQHMTKFACITSEGEILRATKLGHEVYGYFRYSLTLDRGPGTAEVKWEDLTGPITVGSLTVNPVSYYRPGGDYVGAAAAQALSIRADGIEIFPYQDRSPDPGRTSGGLRVQARWGFNLEDFTGLTAYGLRGEHVPDDISHLVAGVSDGYPPVSAAGGEVDPNVFLLFSDDWSSEGQED